METRLAIEDWDELIWALDRSDLQTERYLDRTTGEILSFTRDAVNLSEDVETGPTTAEWLQTEMESYRRVLDDGLRYVLLDSEANEWERMASFVQTIEDQQTARRIADSIHGRGAFRRFRNEIRASGLEDQWYAHERACQVRDALNFLRAQDIEPANPPAVELPARASATRDKILGSVSEVVGELTELLEGYRRGQLVEHDVARVTAELARQLETLSIEVGD